MYANLSVSKIFIKLCSEMSQKKLTDEKCVQPVLVLRQLTEVRLTSGERPVCDLIVKHPQFLPEGLGPSAGLQVATTSFLGAFLAPSVFPEEDTGTTCFFC